MIQWFPGHMAKAINEIKKQQKIADAFVIVIDSRIPLSSYNSELDKIAPHKPRLFIFSKKDYADLNKLKVIIDENYKDSLHLIVNLKDRQAKRQIENKIKHLLKLKKERDLKRNIIKSRLRLFVMGIPNSGKSTFINLLTGQSSTKVANTPGVTRNQQWYTTNSYQLLDTPGILWPKFEDQSVATKLAIIGSIRQDILNLDDVAKDAYILIRNLYPEIIEKHFGSIETNDLLVLEQFKVLANKKGFLLPKGIPNYEKALKWFLNFLRDLKGVTYE